MLVRRGGLGDLIFGARTFGQINRIMVGIMVIRHAVYRGGPFVGATGGNLDRGSLGNTSAMTERWICRLLPLTPALALPAWWHGSRWTGRRGP